MRQWMMFAVAMFVAFSFESTAEAGKKKKDEGTTEAPADSGSEAKTVTLEIGTTGIADIDNVFQAAIEPVKTVSDTRTAVDNLTKNLVTALGLTEGAAIGDALADLKAKAEGKITVAMNDQAMPKLSAADGVPANVQAAIDGVNASIDEISALVPKLANIPNDVKSVVAAAAAINPASLANSGVSPTQVPKMMKTVNNNLKTLGATPGEVAALVTSVDALKNSIATTFAN